MDILNDEEYLEHYGTPRHSGRYPWGSGENPYQRNSDFMRVVNNLKKKGLSDVEIAKRLNMSTGQLRDRKSIAKAEIKQYEITKAVRLREKGMSLSAIAQRLGRSASGESYVRTLLKSYDENKENVVLSTAEMLKKQVEEKGYIDIGEGVENGLGITQVNLRAAKQKLLDSGYRTYSVQVEQATNPGKKTTVLVLCKEDAPYPNFKENPDIIKPIKSYSVDGGKSYLDIYYPTSISSSRLQINYGDQGGTLKDGVIEIRRGVDELSLGGTEYAQVRIAVDNKHYLKGMAVYADDLPEGVDIRFNSNKPSGTPLEKVLKPFKVDKSTGEVDVDNPFGASLKAKNGQRFYIDPNTGEKKLSPVNIVREEGDWDEYSKTLPSQFLSKQPKALIDKQLGLAYADSADHLDEIINTVTVPEVKRALLTDFADKCDTSSYELKAASLPGQASKVLLPVNSLADDEVYAPTYQNGTKLALVRYPHGSITEIPIVTVNNSNEEGKKMMGTSPIDAIGINQKVASQLSGADFDGDTVTAIPTKRNGVNIISRPQLEGLKNFDPGAEYAGYSGMPKMTDAQKGREMGMISNLLTDMTLQGAPDDEVERALKQSMVVIDAQKHGYDYKRSAEDLNIQELKDKYQEGGGASTLISKAKSPVYGRAIKRYDIDPNTGEKIPVYDTNSWVDKKTGETRYRTEERPYLATLRDANEAVSPYQNAKEKSYANYSNQMKQLANTARLKSLDVGTTVYDKDAAKIFDSEVQSIKNKISKAVENAPRERQAQLQAAYVVNDKIRINEWDKKLNKDDIKKVSTKALAAARTQNGAAGKDVRIQLSEREWEAIQAGAVRSTDINKVIRYSDSETLKRLALPKESKTISESKRSRIIAMKASGYTIADIADTLGISTSSVSNIMKEERSI